MKIWGISFGRKNQRCDIMVKEALFAAKAAGAEVQFINTMPGLRHLGQDGDYRRPGEGKLEPAGD